jgi:hypothetical protein
MTDRRISMCKLLVTLGVYAWVDLDCEDLETVVSSKRASGQRSMVFLHHSTVLLHTN